MGIRTVAQGLIQQPQILEAMVQPLGQDLQLLPPGGGQVCRLKRHQTRVPGHRQGITLFSLSAICLPPFPEK
jgi:hypothetical protein